MRFQKPMLTGSLISYRPNGIMKRINMIRNEQSIPCTDAEGDQRAQGKTGQDRWVKHPGKEKKLIIRHRSYCRLPNSQSREKSSDRMCLLSAVSKQSLLCCSIKPL